MKNKDLDLLSAKKLVELFLIEEEKTIKSLKKQKSNIIKAINAITKKSYKVEK